MKLLIAIPALNEEDSIESIIQRSLAARDEIVRNSPVDEVEITVVSDGSTDRTVERASRYAGRIHLIVFPENRGYGAAIQEAWRHSDADLLGFLDADGTCDPLRFTDLCAALERERADVVLGCRLNRDSRMPALRRAGNVIFAALLSLFSSARVRDTASGMRVVRRRSLPRLYPLPAGLHFTPAMSARAMLSDALKIIEVDMPYQERVGESKLRVGADGIRFLRVIVETAFLYRPSRPFGIAASLLFLAAAALMISPLAFYLRYRFVQEWMIYRFLVSDLAGTGSCLCACAALLTSRIAAITLAGEADGHRGTWVHQFFRSRWFWLVPGTLVLAGSALVMGSLLDLLRTGATYEHWSRYIVMVFCFSTALMLSVTRTIDFVLDLVAGRMLYRKTATAMAEGAEHVAVYG